LKMERKIDELIADVVQAEPVLSWHLEENEPRTRVAAALTRLRRSMRMTQRKVASAMRKPQSTVARLENPVGHPQTTEALAEYAQACGLGLGLVFVRQQAGTCYIVEATAIHSSPQMDDYLRSLISERSVPQTANQQASKLAS
jgi:transcriptional regulator with XRE-family HTH domain